MKKEDLVTLICKERCFLDHYTFYSLLCLCRGKKGIILLLWQIYLCLCWWTAVFFALFFFLFFFPLCCFGVRYFYQLHGVSFCVSTSVSLLSSAFWHLPLQINQPENISRSCMTVSFGGRTWFCSLSCLKMPVLSLNPPICPSLHRGFVCLCRKWTGCWDKRGAQATWCWPHRSLSPLWLSLSSPCPSICPCGLKDAFVPATRVI